MGILLIIILLKEKYKMFKKHTLLFMTVLSLTCFINFVGCDSSSGGGEDKSVAVSSWTLSGTIAPVVGQSSEIPTAKVILSDATITTIYGVCAINLPITGTVNFTMNVDASAHPASDGDDWDFFCLVLFNDVNGNNYRDSSDNEDWTVLISNSGDTVWNGDLEQAAFVYADSSWGASRNITEGTGWYTLDVSTDEGIDKVTADISGAVLRAQQIIDPAL
jgi:hypothetical protein